MRFYLPGSPYDADDAKARRVEDIVTRVEALPGVQAAFASNFVPIGGGGNGGNVRRRGAIGRAGEGAVDQLRRRVAASPEDARPARSCAAVISSDAEGATKTPVAVINQAMAKRLWPDEDPLGRRFRMTATPRIPDWFTVVGVVADFHHGLPDEQRPAARSRRRTCRIRSIRRSTPA